MGTNLREGWTSCPARVHRTQRLSSDQRRLQLHAASCRKSIFVQSTLTSLSLPALLAEELSTFQKGAQVCTEQLHMRLDGTPRKWRPSSFLLCRFILSSIRQKRSRHRQNSSSVGARCCLVLPGTVALAFTIKQLSSSCCGPVGSGHGPSVRCLSALCRLHSL